MCFVLSHFCQIRRSWDEFKSLRTALPCWSVLGHTGVRRQRGRAVLVQTNSQGLDALIGFLGDSVQTHQQHPQYLGARVKTISTADLSAIITTLATVLRACSKPPDQTRRITQVTFQHVKAHSAFVSMKWWTVLLMQPGKDSG